MPAIMDATHFMSGLKKFLKLIRIHMTKKPFLFLVKVELVIFFIT